LRFLLSRITPIPHTPLFVYAGGEYFVYPEATDITEAATGIMTILEEFKKIGIAKDYNTDVRMITYKAQMDAPSVIMRRLKRGY